MPLQRIALRLHISSPFLRASLVGFLILAILSTLLLLTVSLSPSHHTHAQSAPPAMGINLESINDYDGQFLFADVMKQARHWGSPGAPWDGQAKVDSNGWPLQDVGVVLAIPSNDESIHGTYGLSFTGQATVTGIASAVHVQNSQYNATTNTTTAQLVVAPNSQLDLAFTNTKRNPGDTVGTGITNVQIMLPTAWGSTTSYPFGTLFTTQALTEVKKFRVVRFMQYSSTIGSTQVNWSDRRLPGYFSQSQSAGPFSGAAWEYAIELCNQANVDAYVTIPEMATDEYVTKLAQLIKYGSDGANPYTAPQSHPVYPPLNANLHVYVENSNELWNSFYTYKEFYQNKAAVDADISAKNQEYQILNFDNELSKNYWVLVWRRIGLRAKEISNDFRAVFGDGAMPPNANPQIRPVLEWQYGNAQDTANQELTFINNYFNNADGKQHVSTPHPVNYFFYGGGAGSYTITNNDLGSGAVTVPNSSFEVPHLSANSFQQNPSGASWSFSGNAGIAANGSSLGNPNASDGSQVAYLAGNGASMSIVQTLPAGRMGLEFRASYGAASGSVSISYDNTQIASLQPWDLHHQTFDQLHGSNTFTATAGTHTITFTSTSGNPVFFDTVIVGTIDAMYNAGLNDFTVNPKTGTVVTDVKWTKQFGLQDVSYEGGFHVGADTSTDVQLQANLDPRAKQFELQTQNEFTQDGGALLVYYVAAGYSSYGMAMPDVENLNTPKLQAIDALNSGNVNNLVQNPGFETGDLTGWTVWVPSGQNTSNAFVEQGGHTGTYRLAEWNSSSAFQVSVYQTFSTIRNGTYTLSGWIEGSGASVMQIRNGAGGNVLSQVSITNPVGNWQQISTTATITGGQADIEFDTQGGAGAFLRVDDVAFTLQNT